MHLVTQPHAFGDHPAHHRHVPRRPWIAGNAVALLAILAVAVPGLMAKDESPVAAAMTAICFFTPMRVFSAAMEWYLTTQYAYRSVLFSHLVGVGFGAMLGVTPEEDIAPGTSTAMTGLPLAVFSYLVFALFALACTTVVAAVRHKRRGGPPLPSDRRPLRALPALFWFNAVFVVVIAILIAPGVAAQDDTTPANAFSTGMLLAVLLRLPGVAAEWWLIKWSLRRTVYAIHIGSALLALPVVLLPAAPSAEPFDPLGGGVGVYLIFELIAAWALVAVIAPIRAWRGRGTRTRPVSPAPTRNPAYPAPEAPESMPATTYRGTAPVRSMAPATERLSVVATSSAESSGTHSGNERNRTLRNEIGLGMGIVTGLASLVQGFDDGEVLRTAFLALAVGGLGLSAVYALTRR